MSEKQTMKELIILMRDTFTGKIHVDDAIKKFNQFIEETEDFEHENRIYTLEGQIKILIKRVNFLNGKLSVWEQLDPLMEAV